MTTYNEVFDEKQYREVNLSAAQKYLDMNVSAALPLISTELYDAYEYLQPKTEEAYGVSAGVDYVEDLAPMSSRHEHEVIELYVTQGLIKIRNQDIWKYGDSLIADKYEAKIDKIVNMVDDGVFHGPKNKLDIQIAEGIIGQLTSIENLSDAGDHVCSVKGAIWHWVKGMVEDIPLAIRQSGPPMVLFINEKTITEARSPNRIYQDKVEWDFIYDTYIGPAATQGAKIGTVITTDKINAEATDDTDGNGADTADTLGTDGRMLLCVPDPRWGGVIESAGFHKVYEYQRPMSVDMLFGWHGRGYVFDEDAWNYTERLSF